jgi:hypothetical protein
MYLYFSGYMMSLWVIFSCLEQGISLQLHELICDQNYSHASVSAESVSVVLIFSWSIEA